MKNIMAQNKDESSKSDISKREEEILQFWQDNSIFEKTLEKTKDKKPFVFYDGPPFATGTPHYGHLVASAMKDAVPRYWTMKGYFVERQWGWDCHGLPIEQIVEKEIGTKSKKEIEEMGVEKFNNLCREKIFTYVDAWNEFIPRFGRWADMETPYRTMDTTYMESEWWAFKELYDKNLIYKDYRSMHICPRCETTLAQAEVAEGYETVKDISVVAKFELEEEPNTFLLAWTTTPWTLPGNVALAMGKDISYAKVKHENEMYILAEDRIEDIFKNKEYEIVEKVNTKDLVGKSYKPLFTDYANDTSLENHDNGWKVYTGDFVNTDEGTGIVHIAPAFGEEDMDLGKKENLPFVQHIGMDGIITSDIKELAGHNVKPKDDPQATDVEIIKLLAEKSLLFSKEKYEHSYPHCWRCDTPLLNYATSSWFVSVTDIKKNLIKYSEDIEWSPEHIKKGRWADWVSGARDWSISRQRFWANTIPVWENEKTEEKIVIGSVDELKQHIKKSGNTYFVMRHGHAESNEKNIVSNDPSAENHVTEQGKKEIQKTAKKLKKEDIDIIIASPFVRTQETARLLADELGISKSAIKTDNRLGEINTGEFNNRPNEEYHAFFNSREEQFTKRPNDGETLMDVKKRVMQVLMECENSYKNKKVLFVTHEYPAWMLVLGSEGGNISRGVELKERETDNDFPNTGEVLPLSFVPLPYNENYELDLHRPYIDNIVLEDKDGNTLKRVPDVLDTWFDSGSVPFSSYHYPFENKKKVESRIPADFIAEGQDQVSKWFYYQHVLAGGIFQKPAFKNVIVNGIVLAEDGKKMSKRLQNYPDPILMIDKYGADAVRYYLLSSPVVRAESLNFSEKGVNEIYKKLILRLENVLSFYEMYAGEYKKIKPRSKNVLDEWILARLNEFIATVTDAMDTYQLDKATRPFMDFVDDLSTWYIRRSRDRFKSDDKDDKESALSTTHFVLEETAKIIAPFMPFTAEHIYRRLGGEKESVHLEDWPKGKKVNNDIIKDMYEVRQLSSRALEERARAGIKVRQPLGRAFIKNKIDNDLLALLKSEINVKEIDTDNSISEDIKLDTEITPNLRDEGIVRELTRRIQDMRKKEGLKPGEYVNIHIETTQEGSHILKEFEEDIKQTTHTKELRINTEEDIQGDAIEGISFALSIEK